MAFDFEKMRSAKLGSQYELLQQQFLEDLNSTGCLLKHSKSGARIVLLSNEDENKVFSIGFKTPPNNDTGLQHIIEHTVLCGSDKYPVKDPFVELCKGSLNTFLNAMTYPDKTVYPVASCNLVDFKNIMDVYMDAVFYPNIYKKKEIFQQEGWHYEMEDIESPLTYNGVVYNEMKGVYSSPDELLSRYTFQSLFPDTTYGFESGGDPRAIVTLQREDYLDYHKKFYHPANSYIYLHGDMDMEERLEYLDKEYLSKFDKNDVKEIEELSAIPLQKAFDKKHTLIREYAITEDESIEKNSYLSWNVVTGTSLDAKLYLAMQVLDYALVLAPGAVLKQTLIDKGIGLDVYSSFESSMAQPVYSVISKNAEEADLQAFEQTIQEVLTKLCEEGMNEQTLLAGINYYEFKYREADFGQFPKGLMYGLQMMDSWLYDENEPFMHIEAGDTFAAMKEDIQNKTGYFEKLIREYLLQNTHVSYVVLNPKKNLTEEMEAEEAAKLEAFKRTLTEQQKAQIVADTKALKAYQEEPSSQEDLESIPMLSIGDIKRTPAPLYIDEQELEQVKVIRHNLFTNRIAYLLLSFDCRNVPEDLIPYVGLLTSALGMMDTDQSSYADLSTKINLNTGGISTNTAIYLDKKDTSRYSIRLEVRAKTLFEKTPVALELIREFLFGTHFQDYKRLKEIIATIKSRLEAMLTSSGHSVAMITASAQFSPTAYYSDQLRSYSFYCFIERIEKEFDSCKEAVAQKLSELIRLIFTRKNLIVSLNANDEGYELARSSMAEFLKNLPESYGTKAVRAFQPKKVKLGLTSSSQVQYVARCGNFRKDGLEYTGALKVLKVIFSYDYLWINVRVKGGAYGCMSGFAFGGDSYMISYRDPNLAKTNEIFEGAADYVKNFTVSDRDMTKYIIGTVGDMDTPLTPATAGARSFGAYMSHVTIEDYEKERLEVLEADQEHIRALAPLVESVLAQDYFCVVGNTAQIQNEKAMFDKIETMLA